MPLHAWHQQLLYLILLVVLFSAFAPASVGAETNSRKPAENRVDNALPITGANSRSELLNYVCHFTAKAGSTAAAAQTPAQIETNADRQSTGGRDLVFSHSPDAYWFSLRVHNPPARQDYGT